MNKKRSWKTTVLDVRTMNLVQFIPPLKLSSTLPDASNVNNIVEVTVGDTH